MNQQGLGQTPLLAAVFVLLAAGGGWYYLQKNKISVDDAYQLVESVDQSPESNSAPKTLDTESTDQIQSPSVTANATPALNDSPSDQNSEFDTTQIAVTHLGDAEFKQLTERLRENPELLNQLTNEFRANTDPDRAKRLAEILGQFNDPAITEVGAELAMSGDVPSQQAGLNLLGRQTKSSHEARAKISEVIAIESNPVVLVSALNALAKPVKVDQEEQQQLLDQFERLYSSDDPLVRSHSLSLMSAWSRGADINETLVRGLSDPDERVRASATFALVKTRYPTEDAKQALFNTLANDAEQKRTREGALYALKRFDLTETEQRRADALKSVLEQLP